MVDYFLIVFMAVLKLPSSTFFYTNIVSWLSFLLLF